MNPDFASDCPDAAVIELARRYNCLPQNADADGARRALWDHLGEHPDDLPPVGTGGAWHALRQEVVERHRVGVEADSPLTEALEELVSAYDSGALVPSEAAP